MISQVVEAEQDTGCLVGKSRLGFTPFQMFLSAFSLPSRYLILAYAEFVAKLGTEKFFFTHLRHIQTSNISSNILIPAIRAQ